MSDLSPDLPVTVAPRLSRLTTLRLGGPAERLLVAGSAAETVDLLRRAAPAGPVLVLGGGSNVVVADEGVPGTVLRLESTGVRAQWDDDAVVVTVEAGENWSDLTEAAEEYGWSGIECLAGIPGSVGATPIQNVGAYGQEVAETISAVRVYDRVADEVRVLAPAECGFGYRTSVFKRNPRWVVLSVDYRLAVSRLSTPIRYAELARALGVALGDRAPVADVRAAVRALRAGKGMVLDAEDRDTWSVGSFFTNPVLDAGAYEALRGRVDGAGEPPSWPGTDNLVKVSAAWLIERAGFTRGYGTDRVAISGKHTLALTNRGDGSTAELLALAREIRDGVHARFGVTLHPEPVLVNCAL